MKKSTVLLYLLLFSFSGIAQQSSSSAVDSIHTALLLAEEDTGKVKLLLEAAILLIDSSPQQSLAFAEEAFQLSKKLEWNDGILQYYRILSYPYWKTENWVKVIEHLQVAADLVDDHTSKMIVFNLYNQIGTAYTYLEIYPLSMEYFRKSLVIIEELKNEELTGITLGNIGWVYYNTGDYRAALNYGRKNLETSLKYDNKNDIANCYGVGGLIYAKLNMSDSAIYFFEKALTMVDYIDIPFHSAVLNGLGEVYGKNKDYKTALQYLLQGAEVAGKNKNYRNLQDIYFNLSTTYEQLNNTGAAYEAYKNYNAYKDSSNTAVKQHEVAFLELQSETKKNDMMQQAALQRQTLIRNASMGGLVLAAILVFVLILRFREKKKAHAQLEDTIRQLKATQQQLIQQEKLASLGQLTAGVAHEINNPINFVSGNVNPLKRNFFEVKKLLESYELLLSQTDKKEAADKLKKESALEENLTESEQLLNGIAEGSKRTAEIVKGLRNFSRLDEEEMKMANINEGIESTLMVLQNKIKHQNIEVIKSFENIPDIRCYPGQLNQVFMNLISNGIDAIELAALDPAAPGNWAGERKIFLSTSLEDKSVKISVRDTGAGMNEEVKKKLFDPFFTTKAVGKGTGLGLSISYGIIEKHHGTIEVISEAGHGTEFLIRIPAVQANN
ncbi:MAG TPA: tetratricopeptide repeat protein [Chitinophagales bacterium]|nr:tetratricopeptide repeat protein [Chitinophagales bacterium]